MYNFLVRTRKQLFFFSSGVDFCDINVQAVDMEKVFGGNLLGGTLL